MDLKKLDVLIDYPPSKLKSGSGEAVCQALHGLVQVALKAQRFKFKQPIIPDDEEGATGGDDGVEEGNDDVIDMNFENNILDDDIAELVETGANDIHANDFENPDNAIIETDIDPDEWQRE